MSGEGDPLGTVQVTAVLTIHMNGKCTDSNLFYKVRYKILCDFEMKNGSFNANQKIDRPKTRKMCQTVDVSVPSNHRIKVEGKWRDGSVSRPCQGVQNIWGYYDASSNGRYWSTGNNLEEFKKRLKELEIEDESKPWKTAAKLNKIFAGDLP